MRQIYFPEGCFSEALAITSKTDISKFAGSDSIVSGEAIAYNSNTRQLEIRLCQGMIGILQADKDEKDFTYHSLVGTFINLRIISKIDEHHWLCERKTLVEKAKEFISCNYKNGQVYKGAVDSYVGYGCFIDIGWGATGLLHNKEISEFSGRKIKHPSELLKLSQNVKVSILKLETNGIIALNLVEVFPLVKNA